MPGDCKIWVCPGVSNSVPGRRTRAEYSLGTFGQPLELLLLSTQKVFSKSPRLRTSKAPQKYFKVLQNPNFTLLVLTNFHKNYLKNLGFIGNNVYVLPNSFSSEIIIKKNNENNDLVYAGRISKEKGVEELVKAFINSQVSNLNLVLIGEGPLKQTLENTYSNHANIKILGQKSNFETREIIANSKAVVTATKLFEGQPTLLCEASFMGVPSIFPNFGGIHEFFPENTDLSFKQFDYLDLEEKIKLLNISSFKKEGIKNKNFLTDRFSEKIIVKKFMDVIND